MSGFQIAQAVKSGVLVKDDAVTKLLEGSMAYLVGLFGDTALTAEHAARETVDDTDISLARRIRGERFRRRRLDNSINIGDVDYGLEVGGERNEYPDEYPDVCDDISDDAILQLAIEGGVERISDEVYDVTRGVLQIFLDTRRFISVL